MDVLLAALYQTYEDGGAGDRRVGAHGLKVGLPSYGGCAAVYATGEASDRGGRSHSAQVID